MLRVTDQLGNIVSLRQPARRIVSLVPSQSEFLWHIGARSRLAGITKFCIHPDEMYRTVARVGGTKQVGIEKVLALRPDLVIGNREENDQAQIGVLSKHCPVWMSDVITISDALAMMRSLGELCGESQRAGETVRAIEASLLTVKDRWKGLRVAYFIWKDPWMLAGGRTFIHSMLSWLGCINVAPGDRYPVVTLEEVARLAPDVCLLSEEPFPFSAAHIPAFSSLRLNAVPVPGEPFSWYGSRMLHAAGEFTRMERLFVGKR